MAGDVLVQSPFTIKTPARQATSPPLDRTWLQTLRAEAERYLSLFETQQEALAGRVRMLRFILELQQQPRERWAPTLAGMREDHASMVAGVLKQSLKDPGLEKRLRIAVERFDEAAKAAQEAQALLTLESTLEAADIAEMMALLQRLGKDEASRRRRLLAEFDLNKFKTRLYLLTTFDLLFKNDPVLNQMFPCVERTAPASKPSGPKFKAPGDAPIPKQPRPVQTMANPPPPEGFLQGVIRRIKRE